MHAIAWYGTGCVRSHVQPFAAKHGVNADLHCAGLKPAQSNNLMRGGSARKANPNRACVHAWREGTRMKQGGEGLISPWSINEHMRMCMW